MSNQKSFTPLEIAECKTKKIRNHRFLTGFTLIELLVVIAVMGILASIILVSLAGARERAKYARAQLELDQIRKAIILAQYKEDKVLWQITQFKSSEYSCRYLPEPLNTLDPDHPCIEDMTDAFQAIGLPLMRDPWGSPYLIDENELDGYPSEEEDCRHDTVNSAGPNRIYKGAIPSGPNPCRDYHDEEATPCDDDGPRVKVPFHECSFPDTPCPSPPYSNLCPQ